MVKLNEKIVSWFQSGKLREALLGHDEYRIPDPGNPEIHDYMLVTYVLINWATQHNGFGDIVGRLENVLVDIASRWPIELLDILLAYTINARDLKKRVHFDASTILDLVQKQLSCAPFSCSISNANFDMRVSDLRARFTQLDSM